MKDMKKKSNVKIDDCQKNISSNIEEEAEVQKNKETKE